MKKKAQTKIDVSKMSFDMLKTDSGLTRISINNYKEKLSLDIRHYYFNKEKEEFAPSPKGTGIPLDKMRVFRAKISKLIAMCEEAGLIEEKE